jgi:predicted Zn-dependent protease
MPRLKFLPGLCASFCVAVVLAACETAPVTERDQLILLPESKAAELGLAAYREILDQSEISEDHTLNQRVRDVGTRIAKVSDDPGYDWEFTVIEDPTPNAFALPGGKVGVNTGLFQVAKNDDQLAAVMAHEVAHAIARHSSERMSSQLLVQGGLAAAGIAASTQSEEPSSLVQLAAAAATLGITLPFSRSQEAEADHIGLIYMAEAGYDPREAVELWKNFESLDDGRPPEFLSTHPSPENRIERLQGLMPEALAVYRGN